MGDQAASQSANSRHRNPAQSTRELAAVLYYPAYDRRRFLAVVAGLSCRCCGIARNVHPRYSTELAGHLSILSRNYFSATCPVEWRPGPNFHPILLV